MMSVSPGTPTVNIGLLERLTNAIAVSGDEREVRSIVLEEVQSIAEDMRIDALGNVLVTRRAKTSPFLKVMVAAHMDEVGFMIVDEDEGGLYRFAVVGGMDSRLLPGKAVLVGKDHLPGVIGARPIHLSESSDLERAIPVDSLRIDLGTGGAGKAQPGDRAGFATRFQQSGPSLIAKALDNRLGVAALIELVKNPLDHIELQAAFTVQEEIGLRGAGVAAYAMNPDRAIVIDSTPAFDLPVWDAAENYQYNTRLGAGPAIYTADAGTLSDPRLVSHLIETAEAEGIPYQLRQPGGGGTDAGAIHRQRAGIPTVSLSVPGRYAHTPILLARVSDWQNTLALVYHALRRLHPSLLTAERS